MTPRATLLLVLSWGLVACGDEVEPPDGWLDRLAEQSEPPPGNNWPVAPDQSMDALAHPITILSMEETEAGTTNAWHANAQVGSRELELKWKPVRDASADSFNNTPRKEIAAFLVQKWFLDPEDWVVPPVRLACLEGEQVRAFDEDAEAQVPGTGCVLGAVTLWLQNLTVPDELYDEARFYDDPVYAWHMADFNLFTYVVQHRDGAANNVPTSDDESNRRIYAIDNGMSFGGRIHNYFVRNWDSIEVPALRAESVERLRAVTRADIDELAVVAMMAREGDRLVNVDPRPEEEAGVGEEPGHVEEPVLTLGLTEEERSAIEERIARLLERVDAGEVAVF